ncbi:14411_t:CDS:1, partial [Racocetra persica]
MGNDEQSNCENYSEQDKSNTDLLSIDISSIVFPVNQDNGIQTHNSLQVGNLTRQMLPDIPNKEYVKRNLCSTYFRELLQNQGLSEE